MAGKIPEIQWEDQDTDFDEQAAKQIAVADDEFASLLAGETQHAGPMVKVGQKASGTIASISATSDDVMIDLGRKLAGILLKQEITDEHGQLKYRIGDTIEAFVVSRHGSEVALSLSQMKQVKSIEELEEAYQQGIPVRGRVAKVNKGGFEVTILGKAAFCPVSQMDARYVEIPQEFVGKDLEFLIESFEPKGRNIVVSRAKLLRRLAGERLQELKALVGQDTIVEGKVTRLEPFGAFVDLSGIEGMVHVSELSFGRIRHPSEVIEKGDQVRATILRIEGDEQRPRISLSLKSTMADPWNTIADEIRIGENYAGTVVKLVKSGAIVQLKPGIDGYLHVSEMAWGKRIHDPASVVKEGDRITVMIRDVDPVEKKISLSMRQKEEDPWLQAAERFKVGATVQGKVTRLKGFGALVEVAPGVEGLLPLPAMRAKFGEGYRKSCSPGKDLEVVVAGLDMGERRMQFSFGGLDADEESRQNYEEYVKSESAAAAESTAKPAGEQKIGSFGALLAAKLNDRRNN